jgi:hypothetical protein
LSHSEKALAQKLTVYDVYWKVEAVQVPFVNVGAGRKDKKIGWNSCESNVPSNKSRCLSYLLLAVYPSIAGG